MLHVHENSEFISKIVQDADLGYSFIPFVGSGLSSPSGIIMGVEFTNYLAFTTYLVLADPKQRPKTHGENEPHRWNIAKKGWPPLPTKDEVDLARDWIRKRFVHLCERLQLDVAYDAGEPKRVKALGFHVRQSPAQELVSVLSQPAIPNILRSSEAERTDNKARYFIDFLARGAHRPNIYPGSFAIDEMVPSPNKSYHQRIEEMGIRSLHDWRETLAFLASVSVKETREGARLVYEPQRDSSVIDSFNTTITRDRKPNLGHKMLAHLAGPLRIQTLLTTNFDTLIEDAYRALSLAIRVLPVTTLGSLPPAATVAEVDSVVKLHGEAHDTRADLSLDDEPSQEDLRTFGEYLTCGGGHNFGNTSPHSKRLLVVGYSGSDNRCVQMIKHWLETAPDHPIVYWVCFTTGDVENVRKLFSAPEYTGRIRITKSSRPDLLLYELYQRIVLSLPPGGLTYEFSHNVPPTRLRKYDSDEGLIERTSECSRQCGDLMEAARVLLGFVGSAGDVRALARDTIVWELQRVLIELISGNTSRIEFSELTEKLLPHKRTVCQWQPWYRSEVTTELESKLPAYIVDSAGGVVRASAIAVEHATSTLWKKVFWMETQDYMDVDAVIRDFFRGLALRLGQFQNRHVSLHPLDEPIADAIFPNNQSSLPDKEKCKQTVKKISRMIDNVLTEYRVTASNLVVMLYGRDSYGTCSGLVPSIWSEGTKSFCCLHLFIEALATSGIKVIYFPLLEPRSKHKRSRTFDISLTDEDLQEPRTTQSDLKNTENQKSDLSRIQLIDFGWPYDPMVEWIEVLNGDKSRKAAGPSQSGQPVREASDSAASVDANSKAPSESEAAHPYGPTALPSEATYSVFADMLRAAVGPMFKISFGNSEDNASATDFKTIRVRGGDLRSLGPKELIRLERRLLFLYSITLFRHSRHPAALSSEATFQCPFRFNPNGIDNDYLRSEESAEWITSLRRAAVFLDKPGGSMWMRRDIRLAIRSIMESIEVQSKYQNAEGEEIPIRRSLVGCRARIHFWIGDWYFKAFCSSGHLTPVIEAVHHRIMAAVFSPFAAPKSYADDLKDWLQSQTTSKKLAVQSLATYQGLIFESSMLEAAKTLLLAKSSLKVWQASSIDASWLDASHRKTVHHQLSVARRKISRLLAAANEDSDYQFRRRLRTAQKLLIKTMKVVCDSFTTEGGGKKREGKADTELSLISQDPTSFNHPEGSSPRLSSSWEVICGNESDFVDKIESQFIRITPQLNIFGDLTTLNNDFAAIKAKSDWKMLHAGDRQTLSNMIWLLGETSYVFLRRAKLMYHATGKISFDCWIKSARACNLGLDLCRHLPFSHLDFHLQSLVKLHSLYAISLANLGRFFEANRHLNEAQALLSKTPSATAADFAIVNLRRAEVRLTECYWIRMFLVETSLQKNATSAQPDITFELRSHGILTSEILQRHFGDNTTVRLFNGDSMHEGWTESHVSRGLRDPARNKPDIVFVPPKIAECFRKSGVPRLMTQETSLLPEVGLDRWKHKLQENLLRLYSGTLDEAWSLLEQASAGLSGTSQSSLWWCRYHTLKVRAFSALMPLRATASESLAFRKEPPDLGLHESFTALIRISGSDRFRQFRALKYFFDANHWLSTYGQCSQSQASDPFEVTKLKDTLMPDTFKLAVETLGELLYELAKRNSDLTTENPQGLAEDYPLEIAIKHLYESLRKRGLLENIVQHPSFKSRNKPSNSPNWIQDNWGLH